MCVKERNEQFYVVREVVREFPGITALQVNQATDVPMEVIMRFVELGMVEVMPTKDREGDIDARIDTMIKKAKEMRALYKGQQEEGQPEEVDVPEIGETLDETTAEPKAESKGKFVWHELKGTPKGDEKNAGT